MAYRLRAATFVVASLLAVLAWAAAPRADENVWEEGRFWRKPVAAYPFTPPGQGSTETVVGAVRAYRIKRGDTLLDVARYYDLGYNEILDANPRIDPWVPPVGATILLPTQWVLPCCRYRGLIVNIPEMRLFYFHSPRGDRHHMVVTTFPVGLGREDWRTPRGRFRVRGKTVNPTWVIPESIRREHIRERGDTRKFIPGGDPENPLGHYRLELTLPLYAIHGTNIPWGVGRQVSHGCIRLYPEDIARLFPMVPIGTPGEFIYQPVKAGMRNGRVYVEVHRDIYGYVPALWQQAVSVIERNGWRDLVDDERLLAALERPDGVPVDVTRRSRKPSQSPAEQAAAPATSNEGSNGAGVSRTDHRQAADD